MEVRFPKITTPQEFLDMFIFHYALQISVQVHFIDSTNSRFLLTKDDLNDRLGDGPDEEMETSAWELGVLQGLRKGPWLFVDNNHSSSQGGVGRDTAYTAMHWGRVLTAAKKNWERPDYGDSAVLVKSLGTPLRDCIVFLGQMPKQCKEKLKDIGNVANTAILATTPLERYGQVPQLEATFERQKLENGWTIASIGSPALERKKLTLCNSLMPLQPLPSYRVLEAMCSFHNQSSKLLVLPNGDVVSRAQVASAQDRANTSPWFDKFKSWAIAEAAWTRADSMPSMQQAFLNVNTIFKKFKYSFDDFICMVMLIFPGRKPVGACALCRDGYHAPVLPTITDKDVESLLLPMPEADSGDAPVATAAGAAVVAAGDVAEKRRQTVWEAFKDVIVDVKKTDKTMANETIMSFMHLPVIAQLKGGVTLDTKQGLKVVKKFQTVRKMMKSVAYSRAKLVPRPSDPDFHGTDGADDEFVGAGSVVIERKRSDWAMDEGLEKFPFPDTFD